MTTAQVVETSVTVNNNSPIQDYVHPDDQTQPTFETTPGFKPFPIIIIIITTTKKNTGALTVGFLADVRSQHAAVKIIPFTVPSIHF